MALEIPSNLPTSPSPPVSPETAQKIVNDYVARTNRIKIQRRRLLASIFMIVTTIGYTIYTILVGVHCAKDMKTLGPHLGFYCMVYITGVLWLTSLISFFLQRAVSKEHTPIRKIKLIVFIDFILAALLMALLLAAIFDQTINPVSDMQFVWPLEMFSVYFFLSCSAMNHYFRQPCRVAISAFCA